MAEIIGIVSGVIAFVGAAQKALNALSDFRSATKEREDLLRHLFNVETTLGAIWRASKVQSRT